ncbi:MAG: helix-turn-helix transcriptional regulator [Clostridia bacterium]|nr:helix-turn-helix transcriptional regulator [Clostridia bacterium]
MGVSAEILGNRLKQVRKKKNYTQEYVAEMIDLSVEHLSRIENGKKNIYLHKLALWCDVLDVPIEEILTGAVTPANPAHNRQFGEIAQGCSVETVSAMLSVCRAIAEVEKRAKAQNAD